MVVWLNVSVRNVPRQLKLETPVTPRWWLCWLVEMVELLSAMLWSCHSCVGARPETGTADYWLAVHAAVLLEGQRHFQIEIEIEAADY